MHQLSTVPSFTIRSRAFTLLELMIAVALASMIVYTAVAAFRVASQSMTVAKRLSVENNMLRAGYYAALEELDFWDLYDNRAATDVTKNPLRVAKKPFAPMSYDPSRHSADPRTWWRGFGFAHTAEYTLKWGNYSLLAKAAHDDPVRAWYPNQVKKLNETLGSYGMISYLPGNAIFSWYDTGTNTSLTMKGEPKDIWHRTSNAESNPDPHVTVNGSTYANGIVGDLLPHRPAHWPGLTVEARRYAAWSSFIDLCQVTMHSPISGETTRLSFWGVGTTLRGARQQRSLPDDKQKLDLVVIK